MSWKTLQALNGAQIMQENMSADLDKLYKEHWLEIPSKLSPAGITFLAEALRLQEFNSFLLSINLLVLSNPRFIVEHHTKVKTSHPIYPILEKNKSEEDLKNSFYRQYFFDAHKRIVDEMLYCKEVDNFLSYISELLALIFTERPEVLKSSEQVRIDYVLQFKDTATLIESLAERKVEKLAYLGVKELADYFLKELNFSLTAEAATLEMLIESVETRNTLVHARGKVSKIFKNRLPNHKGVLGKEAPLGDLTLLRKNLTCLAFDIDTRATEKWDLPFALTKKSDLGNL